MIVEDKIHNYTWLPTQDRLQEIYLGKRKVDWEKRHGEGWSSIIAVEKCTDAIYDYKEVGILGEVHDEYYTDFESMEQLWLAIVMGQYGKVWNGEDWVKERDATNRD